MNEPQNNRPAAPAAKTEKHFRVCPACKWEGWLSGPRGSLPADFNHACPQCQGQTRIMNRVPVDLTVGETQIIRWLAEHTGQKMAAAMLQASKAQVRAMLQARDKQPPEWLTKLLNDEV